MSIKHVPSPSDSRGEGRALMRMATASAPPARTSLDRNIRIHRIYGPRYGASETAREPPCLHQSVRAPPAASAANAAGCHVLMYGPCDMSHGLDPNSPTRPCGYGDPMMSSLTSLQSDREPGSVCSICSGDDGHCRSLRPQLSTGNSHNRLFRRCHRPFLRHPAHLHCPAKRASWWVVGTA
jgi:hypothetical protein